MRRVLIALTTAFVLLFGNIGWAVPARASDYLGLSITADSPGYSPGQTAYVHVRSAPGTMAGEPTTLEVDFSSLSAYGSPHLSGPAFGFDSCVPSATKIICNAAYFSGSDFDFVVAFTFAENTPSTTANSGPKTPFTATLSVNLPESAISESVSTNINISSPTITLSPQLTASQTGTAKPGDSIEFAAGFTAPTFGSASFSFTGSGATITSHNTGAADWTACQSTGSPVTGLQCEQTGLTYLETTTLTVDVHVPTTAVLGSTLSFAACSGSTCATTSLVVVDDPVINTFTITPSTQEIGASATVAATFTAKASGTHTITITPPAPLSPASVTASVTGAGSISCDLTAGAFVCAWTGAAPNDSATVSFSATVSADTASDSYDATASITPPTGLGATDTATANLTVPDLVISSYEIGIGSPTQHSQVLPGGTADSYVEFVADNSANGSIELQLLDKAGRATITAISGDTHTSCALNTGALSATCAWSGAAKNQVQRIHFTLAAAADADPGVVTAEACAGGDCITGSLTVNGDPAVQTTLTPSSQAVGGTFTATTVVSAKASGTHQVEVALPADSALYWNSVSISDPGDGSCSVASSTQVQCSWVGAYGEEVTIASSASVSQETFPGSHPVTTTVTPPTGTGQEVSDSDDLAVPEPTVSVDSLTMTPAAIAAGEVSSGVAVLTAATAGNLKLHFALDPATATDRARISQLSDLDPPSLGGEVLANCVIAANGLSATCDWVHVVDGSQVRVGFQVSAGDAASPAVIRVEAMPGTQDAGARITYLTLTGDPVISAFTAGTDLAPGSTVPIAATFLAGATGTHTAQITLPSGINWSDCSASAAGAGTCQIVDQTASVTWDAQAGEVLTFTGNAYILYDTLSGGYALNATLIPPSGSTAAVTRSATVQLPQVEATSVISANPANVAAGGLAQVQVDYTAASTGNPPIQFYLDPAKDLTITRVIQPLAKLGKGGSLTNCVISADNVSLSCGWRYATPGQVQRLIVEVRAAADASPGPVSVRACANGDGNCSGATIGILGSPTIAPITTDTPAPGANVNLATTIVANAPGAHTAEFVAPSGARWVSGALTPGTSCTANGQLLSCSWTAAAVGDQVSLTAIASLAADLPFGEHTFTVSVTPPSGTGASTSRELSLITTAAQAGAKITLSRSSVQIGSIATLTAGFTAWGSGSTRVHLVLIGDDGVAAFTELTPGHRFSGAALLPTSIGGLTNCVISGDGQTASCDWYGASPAQVQTLTASVATNAIGTVQISACAEGSTCQLSTLKVTAVSSADDADLAYTGFAGLPLAGIAVGLIVGGAVLRRRRRWLQ